MTAGKGSREGEVPGAEGHEEFLELCALASSGALGEADQKKLQEHLAVCPECREALEKFEFVVDHIIPEMAPEQTEEPPHNPSFSQGAAEASFRKRLSEEKERERSGGESDSWLSPRLVRRSRNFRARFHGYDLWLPVAAGLLLFGTLGVLSYKTGRNRGIEWARLRDRNTVPSKEVSPGAHLVFQESQPSLDKELAARDATLGTLRREIAQNSAEIESLKALESSEHLATRSNFEEKKQLTEERDRLLEQVAADERTLRATEDKLKGLEEERSQYLVQTASLETRVAELSKSLSESDRLALEQQDLLEKDRDIRELIGARDLYITEIFDVARNGETRKASGRVFFTKGKSLIFYAYDLNESPGVKQASTFEAWGQRGPDWRQASKLGIFYEDNASKRRWVVKSNDKKTLDQIDAVFITVEPSGGSDRPTGKPLLFAYLKVTPNHP